MISSLPNYLPLITFSVDKTTSSNRTSILLFEFNWFKLAYNEIHYLVYRLLSLNRCAQPGDHQSYQREESSPFWSASILNAWQALIYSVFILLPFPEYHLGGFSSIQSLSLALLTFSNVCAVLPALLCALVVFPFYYWVRLLGMYKFVHPLTCWRTIELSPISSNNR